MNEDQNLNENNESKIEDIFGSQVENKDETQNIKKSILEKVENNYTPPPKEEEKKVTQEIPKPVSTLQQQQKEQGDVALNGIYNGFFKTTQTQSVADVKVEDGNINSLPPDVYKDPQNQLSRSDITKISDNTPSENPTIKEQKQEVSLKAGEGEFEIKDVEEEKIVIREDQKTIEEFEKKVEEEEKEEFEKELKKQEEIIKKLEEDLNAEMTSSQVEANDGNDYRIRSFIDGEEVFKETKEEENETPKEYIGGSKETSLFSHLASEWGKRMVSIPSDKIPKKIIGKDYIMTGTEKDLVNFVKEKNRTTLNTQTKTVLPFSGLTLYLNSYTGSTLMNLFNSYTRWRAQYEWAVSNNPDEKMNQIISESYFKLRELELKSIYEHVSSIKFAGEQEVIEKPSMEDFFKMVKYPDLNTLYFAVFHSTNKTKRKKYTISCNQFVYDEKVKNHIQCPGEVDLSLYDEELVFTIENPYITKEDFYQMIRDEYPKGKILGTTRIARTEIERLTETKTNITQHVPSLWDYLETLRIMNEIILKDDNHIFSYDISLIDAEIPQDQWLNQRWDRAKLLKSYLYVKKIDFLVPTAEKEFEYRTLSVENNQRELIFDLLNSFSLDDTYLLTKGEQTRDLMTLKVLDYYVPATECPRCHSKLKPVKFDVRHNFFIRISEARSAIQQA